MSPQAIAMLVGYVVTGIGFLGFFAIPPREEQDTRSP